MLHLAEQTAADSSGEGKNVTISRVYSDADMTVNTYTDDKNRTQSAGFIGNLTGKSSVEYVFAAGKVDNKTSEQLYNFIGYAGRAENDGEKQFCYPKRRRSIEYHRRRRTGDLA